MHLLVLSAFRLLCLTLRNVFTKSLNAPFGAQCFPTRKGTSSNISTSVSMHLLVLSAFRRKTEMVDIRTVAGLNAPFGAQCFPTL